MVVKQRRVAVERDSRGHEARAMDLRQLVYYEDDQPVPDENDVDYNWCMAANKWLFALEMMSMAANALSRQTLKMAMRRMMDTMSPDIADRFTTVQLNCLLEVGDLTALADRFINQLTDYPILRNRLSALGEVSKYEFSLDFQQANRQVLQELENDISLVDAWFNIKTLKSQRKNILFLQNRKRFNYPGSNETRHIWEWISPGKGGHRQAYVVDDLSHDRYYMNVPETAVNTNIPLNRRTKVTDINGHVFYEDVWHRNANPTPYTLNGHYVKKKPRQFTLNPEWDSDRLAEEIAFAYTYEGKLVKKEFESKLVYNNITYKIKRTEYLSVFSDNSFVEIFHQSRGVDIDNNLVDDYISLLAIKKL